jgi:hypothetical protein
VSSDEWIEAEKKHEEKNHGPYSLRSVCPPNRNIPQLMLYRADKAIR